jgi:hypothetical protein
MPTVSLTPYWYESTNETPGTWMWQWNYAEYGVNVNITIESTNGVPFQVCVTPADSSHGAPWVWYDHTDGVQGAVTGTLSYGEAYVIKDGVTTFQFITSMTPGAYAPLRIAILPSS